MLRFDVDRIHLTDRMDLEITIDDRFGEAWDKLKTLVVNTSSVAIEIDQRMIVVKALREVKLDLLGEYVCLHLVHIEHVHL